MAEPDQVVVDAEFIVNSFGFDADSPTRKLIARAVQAALELAVAHARVARLPVGFRWGPDAMVSFDFGRQRAAAAIQALVTPLAAVSGVLEAQLAPADAAGTGERCMCTTTDRRWDPIVGVCTTCGRRYRLLWDDERGG